MLVNYTDKSNKHIELRVEPPEKPGEVYHVIIVHSCSVHPLTFG